MSTAEWKKPLRSSRGLNRSPKGARSTPSLSPHPLVSLYLVVSCLAMACGPSVREPRETPATGRPRPSGSPCDVARELTRRARDRLGRGRFREAVDGLAQAQLLCQKKDRSKRLLKALDTWSVAAQRTGNLVHKIRARRAAAALSPTAERSQRLADALARGGEIRKALKVQEALSKTLRLEEQAPLKVAMDNLRARLARRTAPKKPKVKKRALALLDSGMALLAHRKPQKALAPLRGSLTKHDSPMARFWLGKALDQSGRTLASRRAYSRALLAARRSNGRRARIEVVLGHDRTAMAVTLSPKGRYIASGGADSTVRLWDTRTGVRLVTLQGHKGDILDVAFSPTGTLLASADQYGVVKLWKVPRGEPMTTLQGHGATVNAVAFGPRGDRLVTASSDRRVMLWDLWTNERLATYQERWPPGAALAVAFHPKGTHIAVGNEEMVTLWDIKTGKLVRRFGEYRPTAVRAVAFSPDGSLLLSGGADKKARLWEVATGKQVMTFGPHSGPVTSAAFGFAGKLVVTASPSEAVKVWHAKNGSLLLNLQGLSRSVGRVAISEDGRTLASAHEDGTVKLLSVPSGRLRKTLGHPRNVIRSVSVAPKGETLAMAGLDTGVVLWDLRRGTPTKLSHKPRFKGCSLAYRKRGRELLSLDATGRLTVWDTETLKQLRQFPHDVARSRCLAVSPDGARLATGSLAAIQILDPRSGKVKTSLPPGTDDFFILQAVAFSPDGSKLAAAVSGTARSSILVWDTDSGQQLLDLEGHENTVRSVSFSPSGDLLASASLDGTVRLWDITDTAPARILGPSERRTPYESVLFGAQGKRLYCGLGDGGVQVWDVKRDTLLQTWHGHTRSVHSLSLAPNNRGLLISGSADGKVILWSLRQKSPVATLLYLSPKKWLVYTPDGYVDASPQGRNLIQWRLGSQSYSHELAWSVRRVPRLLARVYGGSQRFRLPHLEKLLHRHFQTSP